MRPMWEGATISVMEYDTPTVSSTEATGLGRRVTPWGSHSDRPSTGCSSRALRVRMQRVGREGQGCGG
jgi:hypothetical protein